MKDFRSGPPSANPTKPFWQSPPDARLENYKSPKFLLNVDIVIIGSGLTGALIAFNLLSRPGPKPSIMMLEARGAASGATGRNGGHIKPDCCRGFDEYAKYHGVETALKQCHLEAANLEATIKFIQQHGLEVEVDLVTCDTVDTYMSENAFNLGFKSYQNFKNAGGNVSKIKILSGVEAEKFTRVLGCVGAISYPAASLWPYKLTIAILSMALDLGLNLQTHTVVEIITNNSTGNWNIITNNGEIETQKVVHATNGYTSHLLPEFTGKIIPLKGHVAAIPPSPNFKTKPLQRTMALVWDDDYDYLIQRQIGGKHLILGGGDLYHPEGLLGLLGDSDDSVMDLEVAEGLTQFPKDHFEGWVNGEIDLQNMDDGKRPSKTIVWTGIMGISQDLLPYLGALPGKQGQYIAAGYSGHGMARIFLSVKAFCQFLCGEEIDDRVPSVYFNIACRLKGEIDLVKMGWTD